MRTFGFVVTIVGGAVGLIFLFRALMEIPEYPTSVDFASISIALAIVPYCISRSIQMLGDARKEAG